MKRLILLCILLLSHITLAQDELDYRKLFLGELKKSEESTAATAYKWKVNTPFYNIDLTGDNLEESFGVEKKDGEDWIHFLDMLKRPFRSFRLAAVGSESYLYRVKISQITPRTKLLLLYFFEGKNRTVEYQSTGRLYFVTIDDNKLATLSMFKGPYFLAEKQELPEHYHQRRFKVVIEDINNDNSKEVIVRYHKINRVYSYLGAGKWIGR